MSSSIKQAASGDLELSLPSVRHVFTSSSYRYEKKHQDSLQMYKNIHRLTYFPLDTMTPSTTVTHNPRSLLLQVLFAKTNAYKYSFLPQSTSNKTGACTGHKYRCQVYSSVHSPSMVCTQGGVQRESRCQERKIIQTDVYSYSSLLATHKYYLYKSIIRKL